jgi:hypothetical protein
MFIRYMQQLAMSDQNAEIANMLAAAGFRQKLGVPVNPTSATPTNPKAVLRANLQTVLEETMKSCNLFLASAMAVPTEDQLKPCNDKIAKCMTKIGEIDDEILFGPSAGSSTDP